MKVYSTVSRGLKNWCNKIGYRCCVNVASHVVFYRECQHVGKEWRLHYIYFGYIFDPELWRCVVNKIADLQA